MVNASLDSTSDSKKDHGGCSHLCNVLESLGKKNINHEESLLLLKAFGTFETPCKPKQYFFEVALPHIITEQAKQAF